MNARWRPLLAVSQDSGVSAPEAILDPGHSIQLHSAVVNQSKLDLCLLNYLGQDWQTEYRSVPPHPSPAPQRLSCPPPPAQTLTRASYLFS